VAVANPVLEDVRNVAQTISPLITITAVWIAYHFGKMQSRRQEKVKVYGDLMAHRRAIGSDANIPPDEKAAFFRALNRSVAVFSDNPKVLQETENLRVHQDKKAAIIRLLKEMHADVGGKAMIDAVFESYFNG
jgi:hypothetical protein